MSLESTWKKVTNAIDELLTLKIKTVVTDPEQGNRVMSTKIDLLQGDIETQLHADFVKGELEELRTFHAEQVELGQHIIAEHVRTLTQLVRDLREQEAEPSSGRDQRSRYSLGDNG